MNQVFRLSPVLLGLVLAGCTLGPDFRRPDSQAPQQWAPLQGEAAPSQPQAEPLELRWWEGFHDARLSALIQRVAANNLDLRMATARLGQSRALRSSIAAEQAPAVDLNAGYSRARNSAEGLSDPSGNAGKAAYNLWQGDLVAGWELDLWGRVRRQVEAADASVEVAENDRRGVLLALLAETAGDYIQLRAVQHTLAVTRDNLEVARHSLKLSNDRQAQGVATRLDVAQASAQVARFTACSSTAFAGGRADVAASRSGSDGSGAALNQCSGEFPGNHQHPSTTAALRHGSRTAPPANLHHTQA